MALGYFQQFNDSAFHNLRLRFRGLSNTVHCHLFKRHAFLRSKTLHTSIRFSEIFSGSVTVVCSKLHTFAH